MSKNQVIYRDLRSLYNEWKGEFLNLSRFVNEIIQDYLENLQEADECIV